jgi:hypothetical protein
MILPMRIQRQRTKGWRMPPNTVYVGRPTRWGNSWRIGGNLRDEGCAREEGQPDGWRTCRTPADCVQGFRQFVDWDPSAPWGVGDLVCRGGFDDNVHVNQSSIRRFLAGKNLACWCPIDQACHADVLLEIANRPIVCEAA